MLRAEEVVHRFHGIERGEGHFYEDGVPVAHCAVPQEELMRRAIKLIILFEFVIAESVRLAYELDGKICLVA